MSFLLALLCAGAAWADEKKPKAPTDVEVRRAALALDHLGRLDAVGPRMDAVGRFVHAPSLHARIQAAPATWMTDAWSARAGLLLSDLAMAAIERSSPRRLRRAGVAIQGEATVLHLDEESAIAWVRGPRGPWIADVKRGGSWLSARLAAAKDDAKGFDALAREQAGLDRARGIRRSSDNIRSLLMFLINRRTGKVSGGWPRANGKNFVLHVVATYDLDRRRKENLELLFSPGGPKARPDLRAFEELNKKSIREDGRFSALTHYAGRRNNDREYLVTPDAERRGTPLIADLHFEGIAIVGFSGGDVRVMDRKQLGLGPDDPIVVGDASKSELLRCLSDK